MLKPYKYLNKLKHDARPKLMGFASPGAVRAASLKLLENRPSDDFLLRHALKDCPGYNALKDILAGWSKEGHWGIDRLYMRLKGEDAAQERALRNAIRNLHRLAMYLWNGKGGKLKRTARLLLDGMGEDGFISVVHNRKSKRRKVDHWGGYAVEALITLGIEDDRFDRFFQYLLKNQRADGGWLPELAVPASLREQAEGLPSHPLFTVSFARAMAASDKWRESAEFAKAVEFLLSICFRKDLGYKKFKNDGWHTLACPTFGYSAIEILRLAADAEVNPEDGRIKDIITWLVEQQEKSSLWKTTVNRKPYPDEEMFLALECATTIKELLDDNEESS